MHPNSAKTRLTPAQKSAIWSRKLEFQQELADLPPQTDGEPMLTGAQRLYLKARIQHCNTELVEDKLILLQTDKADDQ